jgi:hypothetical protein
LAPLMAGLQSGLGLISLLRADVEFKGVATKIDARAFEIALAAELKQHGATKVFVPDFVVMSSFESGDDSLNARLSAVQQARQDAWRVAGPLLARLAKAEDKLNKAERTAKEDGDDKEVERAYDEVAQLRRDIEPLTQTLGVADRRFTSLQAQWEKVNDTTGLTPLARMLRAEKLNAVATPVYLHAAIVSSGGHNRVSRSLLRMLFFGDGLSSMGGAVARWALLEADGAVTIGGIRAAREGARFPLATMQDGADT